jgi:hypothetical protein
MTYYDLHIPNANFRHLQEVEEAHTFNDIEAINELESINENVEIAPVIEDKIINESISESTNSNSSTKRLIEILMTPEDSPPPISTTPPILSTTPTKPPTVEVLSVSNLSSDS